MEIVKPVASLDGVDEVRFEVDSNEAAIEKDEAVSLASSEGQAEEKEATETPFSNTYRVIRLNLDNKSAKWQVGTSSAAFFVTIRDEEFWRRVQERKEYFAAGDSLRCEMIMRQTKYDDESTKEEFFIDKVIEHIPGEQQGELL